MMSCKEAVRMMSEGMDRPLSPSERVSLRFHQLFCAGCRNYEKQMAFLRESCKVYLQQNDSAKNKDAGQDPHG